MIHEYISARRRGARFAGNLVSERTLKQYQETLDNVQEDVGVLLENFNYEEAQAFVDMSVAAGKSANTVNLAITICRHFFDWYYLSHNIDKRNPFDGIAKRVGPVRQPFIFKREDVAKLFQGHEKYALLFKLMYFGGLRIGEARTLRKQAVLESSIRVIGKGNKQREVPLLPEFIQELKAFIAQDESGSEYVFHTEKYTNSWEPLGERIIQRQFKETLKRAGLEHATPHNLRHTCASHMYGATHDIVATKELLGHQNIATTMVYVKMNQDDLSEAYHKAFG